MDLSVLHEYIRDFKQRRKKLDQDPNFQVEACFRLVASFERITGELCRLRKVKEQASGEIARLEDAVAEISNDLVGSLSFSGDRGLGYRAWVASYRSIWIEEFHLFVFALAFFGASLVIGWAIGAGSPELAQVVIPQGLLEDILDQRPWFERLQEGPLLGALQIGLNNVLVAVRCFFASALLGLGGWLLLGFNGLFFGAVLGFCRAQEFHTPLLNFVASHGPLELTIIIAATFAGFVYGKVFFMRPYSRFPDRMLRETKRAGVLCVGIIPWLLLAALFEGFVSPWGYLSFSQKLISGVVLAAAFWVWTFFPNDLGSFKRT